jgi:SAM-dependent methyltransferase
MHESAMQNGRDFFATYAKYFDKVASPRIVDVGAYDVNGSLREVCPSEFNYIGVDFAAGKGVDVVLEDPYLLPFNDNSVDIVVSSSCFEHAEFFWLSFLEIVRVLKPSGIVYINAPSGGSFHRYPVDCWRFYPDSGKALEGWARRNGVNALLLESFTQVGGDWHDYVAVFIKDASQADKVTDRILHHKKDFENGLISGSNEVLNLSQYSQNQRRVQDLVSRYFAKLYRKIKSKLRRAMGYFSRAGR